MKYGFGVDLGGTTVKIACFDEKATLIEKWEIPTIAENNGSQILPDIAASIDTYRKEKGIADCLGIGIGVPGPVNSQGIVNCCVNLGWGIFNIQSQLEQLTGLAVRVGNDASVAALGECWRGGGQGCRSMVMVTLGTGVGGGIVIDGRLVHGAHGAGAEVGHITLCRDETEPCSCGKRGCVEQYCSATGIVRLAKKYLSSVAVASCLRSIDRLTCKDIFDAGKAGDAAAAAILDQFYSYLGEFLANLCCVIDPETIVLGGGVSKAGQILLDGVMPYFKKYAFHGCAGVQLALASLGNDAGVYGAFKMILDV